MTLRVALAVATAGTGLIVAWLAFVLIAVLPARSPSSIPAWTAIALLALVTVAVGVAWLARPGRTLAVALYAGGIAVGIVGIVLVASWLSTPTGQDGEGYVLLVGGWLVVHGVTALLAPGLPRRAVPSAG